MGQSQRSSDYLSVIYRSETEREGEGELGLWKGEAGQRHETPSLKWVYKAQVSPQLNPCGAIIPLHLSGRLLSDLSICLPD